MKVDILAIGVHPDDVELSASGTLLKHIAQGKTVGLLDLTRGELGSRGTPAIRDEEAAESAKKMGALFRRNAGMADGFFQHNPENILKIIETVRWCQPEIVLANSLDDRHPDHGRAAKLTADACYLSGLLKIETRLNGENQTHWRPKALYHYIQDKDLVPDFVIDISPYFEEKMDLILTFRSQFFLPSAAEEYGTEPQTPISGKDFMDFMRAKNRAFGRPIGAAYAEGFLRSRVYGVWDLFDLE